MKLLRLGGRKTCDYVLRKGNVWKGRTMTVRWLPGPPRRGKNERQPDGLYVGTFASAKLHKSAVKRNRMRRRVREALRLVVQDAPQSFSVQLLLAPRSASLESPFEDVLQDVRMFLSQLPSWPPKNRPPASGNS